MMIKCQACGTQNLDSSQYCDECGDSLQKYKAPEVSNALSGDGSLPDVESQEAPVFQSASVTSIGVPPVIEKNMESENDKDIEEPSEDVGEEKNTSLAISEEKENDDKPKNVHAKLIIERGQSIGAEFSLASEESNIGRWDADNGVFPDIDLDAHDPEAKVSRKHARILLKNGQYMVEDLGSTNGTFINRGRRLIPGSPHILNDGDEIIVGKTFLRFQNVG